MTRRHNSEGTFQEISQGKWRGRIQLDGKRHSVNAPTQKEAAQKVKGLIYRQEVGAIIKPDKVTVTEWLTHWFENCASLELKANTLAMYEGHLRCHILPSLGHLALEKLQPSHIQVLVREKLKSGRSSRTVQIMRNVLSKALGQAVNDGILLRNPASSVKVRSRRTKQIIPLNEIQLRAFLKEVTNHTLYPAILLLATTGLRRSELIGIKWRDIDFDKRTLEINRAIVKVSAYRCLEGETKRDSSRRLLPLSDQVHSALCRHQECQSESGKLPEYVFSDAEGKAIHPDCVYDLVKRIGKKIGLPDVTVHAFRHTCASLHLAAGEHPEVLQQDLSLEKAVLKTDDIIEMKK